MSDRKKKRESVARKRAKTQDLGGFNQCYKLPDGMSVWKPEPGRHKVDFIPFKGGEHNQYPGELTYEATYFAHKNLGTDGKQSYCSRLTLQNANEEGKRDPIVEYGAVLRRRGEMEEKEIKELTKPQNRQLFMIYDHAEPAKGVQLWDHSWWKFGKLLEDRIDVDDEDWDQFYFPDADGFTVKIHFTQGSYNGNKFAEPSSIDFQPRTKGLPKSLAAKAVCLDDILIVPSYDELKAIFSAISSDAEVAPPTAKKELSEDDFGDDPFGDGDDAAAETETETETEDKDAPDPVAVADDDDSWDDESWD